MKPLDEEGKGAGGRRMEKELVHAVRPTYGARSGGKGSTRRTAAHPTYGSVAPAHSSYCPGRIGVDPVPNHEIEREMESEAGGRRPTQIEICT